MRHRWLAVLVLFLLSAAAVHAGDDMQAEIAQVNTSKYPEITLYVNVTDDAGRIVEGLAQGDFTVTEDGVPVEITAFSAGIRTSISTVLTIDRSSSMGTEGKLEGAKTAAATFVDMMRAQDVAALVAFDSTVVQLQGFTADHSALQAQIQALSLGDCTAWYDGIYDSVDLIAPLEGRRSVILLSDGIDCREDLIRRVLGGGSSHKLDEAIGRAQTAGIPVYAIGLGAQATDEVSAEGFDAVKLQRVASETGGKYYHAPTPAELKELYQSLSETIQKEYILTYLSPRPTYDGTRRDIAIAIQRGGAVGATTSGGYLEKHLVNIRSDWRWFLLLLGPLMLALVIPAAWSGVRLGRAPRQAAAPLPDVPPVVAAVVPPAVQEVSPSTCPRCGSPARAGAKFCPACRQPLAAAPSPAQSASVAPAQDTYCPVCGYPVRPGARFCGGCRRPLA